MFSPRSGRLKDTGQILNLFSRPLSGLRLAVLPIPSDESLGYFQSSANADAWDTTLWARLSHVVISGEAK
jgi:hypothetical protein